MWISGSSPEGTVDAPPPGGMGHAARTTPMKTPHPQTLPAVRSPQGLEPVKGAAGAGWWPWPENAPCGSWQGRGDTADGRGGGALSSETALVAHASVTVPAEAGGGGRG